MMPSPLMNCGGNLDPTSKTDLTLSPLNYYPKSAPGSPNGRHEIGGRGQRKNLEQLINIVIDEDNLVPPEVGHLDLGRRLVFPVIVKNLNQVIDALVGLVISAHRLAEGPQHSRRFLYRGWRGLRFGGCRRLSSHLAGRRSRPWLSKEN